MPLLNRLVSKTICATDIIASVCANQISGHLNVGFAVFELLAVASHRYYQYHFFSIHFRILKTVHNL